VNVHYYSKIIANFFSDKFIFCFFWGYKSFLALYMKKKSIGIKDIAKHAGVSTGPVDKVLNNRGGVSLETRERILKAIKDLGYTPNIFASRLKSAKKYTIAVLMPEATDNIPYWKEHLRGIQDITVELIPFGFKFDIFHFKQNDEESFLQQTSAILDRPFDGVFMVPIFHKETIRFVSLLEKKGTQIVFFDTRDEYFKDIPFIGQHSQNSGGLAAELFQKCLIQESEILIITLTGKDDNHLHFANRENGFREFFGDQGKKIKKYESNLENIKLVEQEIIQLLKKSPSIRGIFFTNGIHKVASIFKPSNKFILIGYDLIEQNLKFLDKGIIDFLISQRPYAQAHSGLKLFYDILIKKEMIKKLNYLPIDVIMKSNVEYYKDF